jgi:Holliday junction resolvasome RuvABC endonuclease subunit
MNNSAIDFKPVAGLDLSLRSAGISIITAPFTANYFTVGYSLSKNATNRDQIERVIHIANKIMGYLKEYAVSAVGIENYAFGGNKLNMQADLGGVIKTQVYLFGLIPILLPATRVRKYLLGKTTSNKKIVRDRLVKLGYANPKNLDESDALAVAHVISGWKNYNRQKRLESVYNIQLFDDIDISRGRTHERLG